MSWFAAVVLDPPGLRTSPTELNVPTGAIYDQTPKTFPKMSELVNELLGKLDQADRTTRCTLILFYSSH